MALSPADKTETPCRASSSEKVLIHCTHSGCFTRSSNILRVCRFLPFQIDAFKASASLRRGLSLRPTVTTFPGFFAFRRVLIRDLSARLQCRNNLCRRRSGGLFSFNPLYMFLNRLVSQIEGCHVMAREDFCRQHIFEDSAHSFSVWKACRCNHAFLSSTR